MQNDELKNGESLDEGSAAPNELENAKRERDEYLDGWRRAKADLINYKKEESQRFEAVARFAHEEFLRDILPVLDSFELCLAALEKQGSVEKGVYMIKGQLEDVLRRRGLSRITVSRGEDFDPHRHEAVAMIETDGTSGTVHEEVEAGYMLYDKVIRPARVRLVK